MSDMPHGSDSAVATVHVVGDLLNHLISGSEQSSASQADRTSEHAYDDDFTTFSLTRGDKGDPWWEATFDELVNINTVRLYPELTWLDGVTFRIEYFTITGDRVVQAKSFACNTTNCDDKYNFTDVSLFPADDVYKVKITLQSGNGYDRMGMREIQFFGASTGTIADLK